MSSPPASTQQLLLNLGLKTSAGLVAGGLVSLLVARRSCSRLFVTGLAAGSGFGYAWSQNDVHLRHPDLVALPVSAEVEWDRYWRSAAQHVPDWAKFK